MADLKTKACNLTEIEIKQLINHHGYDHETNFDERIERMNYLNKRLKAFAEPDKTEEVKPVEQPAPATATKGVW